jgi:hypothetical protein
MKNWIINKDNEVDCICEIISDKRDHITYKNIKDELVAVDKDYFYYYKDLLFQSQGFIVNDKVQYLSCDIWSKEAFKLVKIFPNLGESRRNRFIILKNNTYMAVDKVRLYDKRIAAIEAEMNRVVTNDDAIANPIRKY